MAEQIVCLIKRNCTHTTNIRCRLLRYLITLVRSHHSQARNVWAPQCSSHALTLLEGIQRRATKYILQDFNSSYSVRLKRPKLLPISYWLEIKDFLFFSKCWKGYYDLDVSSFVAFSSPSDTRSSHRWSLMSNRCRASLQEFLLQQNCLFVEQPSQKCH